MDATPELHISSETLCLESFVWSRCSLQPKIGPSTRSVRGNGVPREPRQSANLRQRPTDTVGQCEHARQSEPACRLAITICMSMLEESLQKDGSLYVESYAGQKGSFTRQPCEHLAPSAHVRQGIVVHISAKFPHRLPRFFHSQPPPSGTTVSFQ